MTTLLLTKYVDRLSNPNGLTCHILYEGLEAHNQQALRPNSSSTVQVDRHMTYADYPNIQ